MKKTVLFFFLISFLSGARGQSLERIDSLKKRMVAKSGQDKFETLNSIAWEYRFVNQDSTIKYAGLAYELGKKAGFKKNLAKPLNYIGVAHEYKNESIEAYDYYKQALVLATSQNDELEIAYANNNTGRLFFDQGNIDRSKECYSNALKRFERLSDSSGIAYVYLNLAQLYQSQKNFQKAEEYFIKVYQIRLKMTKAPSVSALLQQGIFYRAFGLVSKSNVYFLKADSLCNARHDEISRADVSLQLAENYLSLGSISEANKFANEGLSYALKNKVSRELPRAYLMLGKVHFSGNNLPRAKAYFEKVAEDRKPIKIDLRMDAHYYLGMIYGKVNGQRVNELENENQYLVLRDSVTEQSLAKQIERLKFQFQIEIEQKNKENELLKTIELRNSTIIKKQQTINIIYGGTLVIIITIAFLLYRSVRMKQRHNIELAKKQEMIIRQSDELNQKNIQIEKINTNLETLVEERTKTIKAQRDRIIEYAYFNSHQIRGPLARILGLISLLNLEFKNDFGPHMQMLSQASVELDGAIRKVTDTLDDSTNV